MATLIPATEVKSRHIIRVHNEGVGVLSVKTTNGITRIRYAAKHGNDVIEVPSDSLVPRYMGGGDE